MSVTPLRDRKIWLAVPPGRSSVQDVRLLYGPFNRPCLVITVRHRRAAFSSNSLVAVSSPRAICSGVTFGAAILE